MRPARPVPEREPADRLEADIRAFVASCEEPLLFERGDAPFALRHDTFRLEQAQGRLILEVWDRERFLRRKLYARTRTATCRLEVAAERMGRDFAELVFTDGQSAQGLKLLEKGERLEFREYFRWMLTQQFVGWTIEDCSVEPDLERTLSARVARAALTRGPMTIAAVAVQDEPNAADHALTTALLWNEIVHQRQRESADQQTVALFLPKNLWPEASHRVALLQARGIQWQGYSFEDRRVVPHDWRDLGNFRTRVEPFQSWRTQQGEGVLDTVDRLLRHPAVECIDCGQGEVSLRVRGKEFVKSSKGTLRYGLDRKQKWSGSQDLFALPGQLDEMRQAGSRGPLAASDLELWLESQVRRHLQQVEPTLQRDMIHGQVLSWLGQARSILDLLVRDDAGRLCIIELKASEEVLLPMQALDYWTRITWHLNRGDFTGKGYFAQRPIARSSPRLLLVAPALQFHPTTELLLSHFSRQIEIERIGLGVEWQHRMQVVFRLRRDERPDIWLRRELSHDGPSSSAAGTNRAYQSEPQGSGGFGQP